MLRSADMEDMGLESGYHHKNPGSEGYLSGKMAAYEDVLDLIREAKKAKP